MDSISGSIKPPFAGYDIVVYFGVGLFVVPFVDLYILQAFDINYPKMNESFFEQQSIAYIIIALSIAFIIYVIGHATAILSGQIVQKPIEATLGKTSYSVLQLSELTGTDRDPRIRKFIRDNLKRRTVKSDLVENVIGIEVHRPRLLDALRILILLPMIPIFFGLYWIGFFSPIHSKMPGSVILEVKAKLVKYRFMDNSKEEYVELSSKWFGALRQYVIQFCAISNLRMHNYFVILGLFRSLAAIFIIAAWFEITYTGVYWITGSYPLAFDGNGFDLFRIAFRLGFFLFGATISMLAFLRFQRRYVEEALYAFALEGLSTPHARVARRWATAQAEASNVKWHRKSDDGEG